MNSGIGFMQGRLSPLVDGKIQAFPWLHWQDEFPQAESLGFRSLEWTLDKDRLYENPLLTPEGRSRILALSRRHSVAVSSLTGDCFMQAPFWKVGKSERSSLIADFRAIIEACSTLQVAIVVVPLVDNGHLDNDDQQRVLIGVLEDQSNRLASMGVRVAFESDLAPAELARFIDQLDPGVFGINYDIGNSAAMGFDPAAELAAYGTRIINVHVKDRVLNGTTVPLRSGAADFDAVFAGLRRTGYRGNYILQTARAADGDHAGALRRYRDMVAAWLRKYES